MEPKPCPWCGSTQIVYGWREDRSWITHEWVFVRCTRCSACGPEFEMPWRIPDYPKRVAKIRALELWNRR